MSARTASSIRRDAKMIKALGGPSAVARRLGIADRQTVHAWITRGIPSHVRVRHWDLFGAKP